MFNRILNNDYLLSSTSAKFGNVLDIVTSLNVKLFLGSILNCVEKKIDRNERKFFIARLTLLVFLQKNFPYRLMMARIDRRRQIPPKEIFFLKLQGGNENFEIFDLNK